jgi:hypothetical protein
LARDEYVPAKSENTDVRVEWTGALRDSNLGARQVDVPAIGRDKKDVSSGRWPLALGVVSLVVSA